MNPPTRRRLRNAAIAALVVYAPMLLIHAACIAGRGFWRIAGVELFVLFPVLALLGTILALPFVFWTRSRSGATSVLFVTVAVAILFVPALGASATLRAFGFRLAARRAEPLVRAVEAYARDQGGPPATLTALVPRHLSALPARVPELEIVTGDVAGQHYGGNDWALVSVVSTGIINWDLFIYYPNQRYPRVGHGGWIERVGRWAYVHE